MTLFIHLYIVGFVRTLIIIGVIYFIIRLFTRYLLPLLLENKIKDMQKKVREQEEQRKRTGKQEGEVTIEYNQQKNNTSNRNEGEYIDFEEVD
jgi:uncharacterized membrane protein YciS (DUF1049 family)